MYFILVERPSTPVGKLTTLFASLLNGRAPRSKVPLIESSSSRPSSLCLFSRQIPKITDFELLKPISRGAFGSVYLAQKKTTADLFAIKVLKKSEMISKNMINHVQAERKILSLAQASFVVTLFYAFESDDHLFLVMEYLIGGDLSSILQGSGPLAEETARFYVAELVLAIEYLHLHGIVHRDLKPDNVLLDADGHIKLTDFGLSHYNEAQQRLGIEGERRILGTPEYLAPEILRHESHGPEVDWWALGVCLFEMLFGFTPFYADSETEIFENILNHKCIDWDDLAECKSISTQARDLIDRLLEPDRFRRICLMDAKKHEFFNGIEWNEIRDQKAPCRPFPMDSRDTSQFDARNTRYESIEIPEDFCSAEPVQECYSALGSDLGSLLSTPVQGSQRTPSPFDGFVYKNIDQLGKINRKLSCTPHILIQPSTRASTNPQNSLP